jgi:PhnB protein
MGADMIDQTGYTKGNNIALAMSCISEAEIHSLFSVLVKGGKVLQALKEEFGGALFGSMEDQFGIRWMLNYNKEKQ